MANGALRRLLPTIIACTAMTGPVLAGSAPAKTPEEAVARLVVACRAGDVDAALELIAQPFRVPLQHVILMEEVEDLQREALLSRFGPQRRIGFRMEEKQDLLRLRKAEVISTTRRIDGAILLLVREIRDWRPGFRRTGIEYVEMPYLAVREGEGWKLLRPTMTVYCGRAESERVVRRLADGSEVEVTIAKFDADLDEIGREWSEMSESTPGWPHESIARLRREKAEAARVAAEVVAGKYATLEEAKAAFNAASRNALEPEEVSEPGIVRMRDGR